MERFFTLSIIIPSYNEEQRLPESLTIIFNFLNEHKMLRNTEVIVVDDGSHDRTSAIVQQKQVHWPQLALISYQPNRGKGAAVRTGILASHGDYIFLCDADLSMPITELLKFLTCEAKSVDVVIGSREAPGAKRIGEPFLRYLMSRVFNTIVQVLVVPKISDTQCGFKLIQKHAAKQLAMNLRVDRWSFDVEMLALARAYGMKILEVPIIWIYKPGSQICPFQDSIKMFRGVLQIRNRTGRLQSSIGTEKRAFKQR
jgi:dolichyl-phosphate beta-glucosyltransferase